MATIIIFASSLLVVSAMLAVKALEIRSGKKNIALELIGKFDASCDRFVSDLKLKFLQTVQSVRYIILVKGVVFFKNLLLEIEEKMVNEYKTRQSVMMGQKNLVDKGSVSFYLKKIAEHKGNGVGGKID